MVPRSLYSFLSHPILCLLFQQHIASVLASDDGKDNAQCYFASNDTIYDAPSYITPCGEAQADSPVRNCCFMMEKNICLSNGLCWTPRDLGGGYLLSSCTDPTYSAPQCQQYCGELFLFSLPNPNLNSNWAPLWRTTFKSVTDCCFCFGTQGQGPTVISSE